MAITRISPTHCKSCMNNQDAHLSIEGDHTPKQDDLSVCVYCGQISVFDAQLNLRAITEEELEDIKTKEPDTYLILHRASFEIKKRISQN